MRRRAIAARALQDLTAWQEHEEIQLDRRLSPVLS